MRGREINLVRGPGELPRTPDLQVGQFRLRRLHVRSRLRDVARRCVRRRRVRGRLIRGRLIRGRRREWRCVERRLCNGGQRALVSKFGSNVGAVRCVVQHESGLPDPALVRAELVDRVFRRRSRERCVHSRLLERPDHLRQPRPEHRMRDRRGGHACPLFAGVCSRGSGRLRGQVPLARGHVVQRRRIGYGLRLLLSDMRKRRGLRVGAL